MSNFPHFAHLIKNKNRKNPAFKIVYLVLMTGLEPAWNCFHKDLNLARLPFRHISIA